jgi:Domain of unknown function (DUF4160)
VPRISEFYGIVIAMYYREHGVAHFHATYAGETAVVAIETGEVIAGSVPPRALRLVQESTDLHRDDLVHKLGPRPRAGSVGSDRAARVASVSWIWPHICTA